MPRKEADPNLIERAKHDRQYSGSRPAVTWSKGCCGRPSRSGVRLPREASRPHGTWCEPVALHASVVGGFPSGTGEVRRVSVVQVLVTSQRGQPYLVPAYRFAGQVTLDGGQGAHAWYALAPAAGQ